MIKFPKMHIAQSTVNRILNTAKGIESEFPPIESRPGSMNTILQSELLNTQLHKPTETAPAPDGAEATVTQAALEGDDLVNAAVSPLLETV